MAAIEHDPRTKQYIKEELYSFLYGPVLKKFKQRLDQIIIRNSVMLNSGYKSFSYKGILYAVDGEEIPRKLNRLVPQMKETMDEYLEDVRKLNNYELPRVLGFITQVLNSSNSFPDYLAVLPESIHRPLTKMMQTCPCREHQLNSDLLESIKKSNEHSIDLLKQRLVNNLLL